MYVAVLVACTLHQCYRMGMYSPREYPTRQKCEAAFGFIATTLHPWGTSLRVQCLSEKEWKMLPQYPNKRGPR